jgi:hypothetical protein
MALNDLGYVIPNRTMVYTAPVGTAAPSPTTVALDAPTTPWMVVGHVGDETGDGNVSFVRDGGDVTSKGSMSKQTIRTITEAVTVGIELDFTQITRETLALYHGTDGGATDGTFEVTDADDGSTLTAVLIVWSDGANRVALYAAKASWSGRDSIDTDSVEDAVRVPVQATFLTPDTGAKYSWLSNVLFPSDES